MQFLEDWCHASHFMNWRFSRAYSLISTNSNSSMSSGSSNNDRSANRRKVFINSDTQVEKFCTNEISTCKYNGFTFLPRFLLEQFRRYSNVFFLIIALLQQIPDVSPTGRYTTAVPFLIILSVSALKEIFEDLKRRRMDSKVNNYEVDVFRNGRWEKTIWEKVKVGELVQIQNSQSFPADLVLLSSSENYGMAYIETSSLDGETNLKIRQAHNSTCHLISTDVLKNFNAVIECEPPNKHLNEFHGKLVISNDEIFPLTLGQLLLRGARLKNTRWIIGAVIYTGHDAKLLMNSKTAPLKRSNIDTLTNRRIIVLFVALVILALVSAIGAEIYNKLYLEDAFYLGTTSTSNFAYNVLTFFILYNNLIPISLQITLDLVRVFQAIYINNDIEMYDPISDTPANARTSNLNEELGQVKFLMSDKTGTLTKNVMKFKRCTIGGINYGDDDSEEFEDETLLQNLNSSHETADQIYDFLFAMAVCHTVVPEMDESTHEINYQASSPDEGALVRGAASSNFIFYKRTPKTLALYANGSRIELDLLNVLEFNSDRKRMSIILRFPDGSIRLFCKGADNVIIERLAQHEENAVKKCQEHLQQYAENGYRTLCFSTRTLQSQDYEEWNKEFYEASIALENRDELLANAAEKIEKELVLIGATAIEDKLQDHVPDTIHALMAADIRVWILTGDKRETAINIAQSSGLCNKSTRLLILDKVGLEAVLAKLRDFNEAAKNLQAAEVEFALVVSGDALREAVNGEARRLFASLAWLCRAVVCCRMTPMQKAEVVELVQSIGDHIVLAVGDGANDVAMIQAANVGVGITGEEGMRAASASDYSIAQFHFLRRLLLVHGTWNFERSVKVILYSFYKNICLYIIELWFAFFSGFSGQTIFDRWTIAMFNVIFTAWPPVIIGLFDRPISARTMMKNPQLYNIFQQRAFSNSRFILWIGISLWHSILLYFLSYAVIGAEVTSSSGRDGGWLMLGNCAYTYVITTVSLKALLECDTWTSVIIVATFGSIFLWFIFMAIYSMIWPIVAIGSDMSGMARIMMTSPIFWAGLLFIPTSTLLVDFVIRTLQTTFYPSPREIVCLKEKGKLRNNFCDDMLESTTSSTSHSAGNSHFARNFRSSSSERRKFNGTYELSVRETSSLQNVNSGNEYGDASTSSAAARPSETTFAAYFNNAVSLNGEDTHNSNTNQETEFTPLSQANRRIASAGDLETNARRKQFSMDMRSQGTKPFLNLDSSDITLLIAFDYSIPNQDFVAILPVFDFYFTGPSFVCTCS
ncbi:Phospholipid-transporting ATPase [Aphelenchoides besseyi]|nr:Phospholipid-transporting ATPase [Aphelenchoides besseyi]